MKTYYLILDSLTCLEQDDYIGKDDIYLKVGNQQTVPLGEFSKNDSKQIHKEISLRTDSEHILELWEKDIVTDDHIGTVNLLTQPVNQLTNVDFNNGTAHYRLFYQMVESNN